MKNQLDDLLNSVGEEYREEVAGEPAFLLEVDLGKRAEEAGFSDFRKEFGPVTAYVPLKKVAPGMKVMFDGRAFGDYGQFPNGVILPGHVARKAGQPFKPFVPNESMVRIIG